MKQAVLTVAILFFAVTAVLANGARNNKKSDAPVSVELQYVGTHKSKPVMILNVKNQLASAYELTITDREGNVFYEEILSGASNNKRITFDETVGANLQLKVNIKGKDFQHAETFNIETKQEVYEHVVVSKL